MTELPICKIPAKALFKTETQREGKKLKQLLVNTVRWYQAYEEKGPSVYTNVLWNMWDITNNLLLDMEKDKRYPGLAIARFIDQMSSAYEECLHIRKPDVEYIELLCLLYTRIGMPEYVFWNVAGLSCLDECFKAELLKHKSTFQTRKIWADDPADLPRCYWCKHFVMEGFKPTDGSNTEWYDYIRLDGAWSGRCSYKTLDVFYKLLNRFKDFTEDNKDTMEGAFREFNAFRTFLEKILHS